MDVLLIEDRGPVRILTMNRPEKRNALNNALTEALLEALGAADADEKVSCIVLTGAGPGFCAGADLSEFKDFAQGNQHLADQRADLTMRLHRIFSHLTKPVVTAINGAAMGGGAGLGLAGDIALMAQSAKIGYPEVQHGIVAAIVMPNLVRQIGRKHAFELLATGKPIDAHRAAAIGLVNRVVPDGELMSEALKLGEELSAVGREAMAATKRLFYEVAELSFDEALAAGREVNQRMRGFRKT
jgi:enoyl-CoA hydratase/carnithine racemase